VFDTGDHKKMVKMDFDFDFDLDLDDRTSRRKAPEETAG
jgi:hypothetical protein